MDRLNPDIVRLVAGFLPRSMARVLVKEGEEAAYSQARELGYLANQDIQVFLSYEIFMLGYHCCRPEQSLIQCCGAGASKLAFEAAPAPSELFRHAKRKRFALVICKHEVGFRL